MVLPASRVQGHKEWAPTRKSDPTYDMNWRRGRVAAFGGGNPPGGDWFDMATAEELRQIVRSEVGLAGPGAPMVPVERWSQGEWLITTIGSMLARIQRDIMGPVEARLQGRIAGLEEAIKQLAATPGQDIDLDAVVAAAQRGAEEGVQNAIEGIDVTVNTKDA